MTSKFWAINLFFSNPPAHAGWASFKSSNESRSIDLLMWFAQLENIEFKYFLGKKKKQNRPERASRACFNSVSKFLICCWVAFTSSVASPDVPLNFSPLVFVNEVVRPPSPLMVDMLSNLKKQNETPQIDKHGKKSRRASHKVLDRISCPLDWHNLTLRHVLVTWILWGGAENVPYWSTYYHSILT